MYIMVIPYHIAKLEFTSILVASVWDQTAQVNDYRYSISLGSHLESIMMMAKTKC